MAGSSNRPPKDDHKIEVEERAPRGMNPILIGLIATVIVLLALIFIVGRDNSSSEDDTLTENMLVASGSDSLEGMCANATTYGLVKEALFREAAQVRGSDQAAYDQLADSAFARMEAPIMTAEDKARGAVSCSGSITLQLPPGLVVAGGRRILSGEIDYALQPAADGSGTAVTLSHAEGIITPLSTLSRVAAPPPSMPDEMNVVDPLAPAPDASQLPQQPQPAAPDEPTFDTSFNCGNARTRSEIAVCSDPSLAALDKRMAGQFNRALAASTSEERALLEQTRSRFLRYRDGCRSNDCIADAYRGRMREITDIMTGHWQAPR